MLVRRPLGYINTYAPHGIMTRIRELYEKWKGTISRRADAHTHSYCPCDNTARACGGRVERMRKQSGHSAHDASCRPSVTLLLYRQLSAVSANRAHRGWA